MYEIESQQMSPEFRKCWGEAGLHLHRQVQDGIQNWLRRHPYPPFLEHLSFRLGNQLFFVRVVDVDGRVEGPASLKGLLYAAEGCGGHACLLPMKRQPVGDGWVADRGGWGLIDARTHAPVEPLSLVTDEKFEMTLWEIHDLAVQVVRDQLTDEGRQLMSWQGNPNVDPAIWFVGDSQGPEWVVVRTVTYPVSRAARPKNWADIAASCAKLGRVGHFASVALANSSQPFDDNGAPALPLWRGYGAEVVYHGLESGELADGPPITVQTAGAQLA
jgi:hypothetical protein